MIKGNYVRSWIQVIIILNFENVRLYFTYVIKLHYLSEMLTLNEMLIFCFERHAIGECPTVVLYKYRKNIKIRKQYRNVKKRSRTIQQAIQPNRNAMASLNHKIIFQLKMLFSQTEIFVRLCV